MLNGSEHRGISRNSSRFPGFACNFADFAPAKRGRGTLLKAWQVISAMKKSCTSQVRPTGPHRETTFRSSSSSKSTKTMSLEAFYITFP